MTIQPPDDHLPNGAQCLPGFSAHLSNPLAPDDTLDASARPNRQYIIVHAFLIPGDRTRRLALRRAIHDRLTELHAIPLHDLAYAVPTQRTGEREMAEAAWNALIYAGVSEDGHRDWWETGDVLYVHYQSVDGMCVLAGAPRDGQRLPQAAKP